MGDSGDGDRLVSLTFDNGPTPGTTEVVLDLLAERDLKATFFVVGDRLAAPGGLDLARRAAGEGHRIGNHTATHTVLLGDADDPQAAVFAELAAPAAALSEFDGPERLYRPYAAGGVLDRRVLNRAAVDHLVANGYTCVLWNSVPHDWDDPNGWVDRALGDVDAQSWTVVVLHDVATGAMDHLPRFLDELDRRHAEVTTDFPASVLPIHRGRITADLSPLMAAAHELTEERTP